MDQLVTAPPATEDTAARRNAFILATAQAFNGAIPPVAISLGGLAGYYLLGPDKSLATLPITAFNLGVALGALPAAMLMRQIGRRRGFAAGTVASATGGVLGGLAILQGSFLLFTLAQALVGLGATFVQQYRFAAADSGSDAMRARAISWVLAGGVVSAVIGPQVVIHTRSLLDPIPFAGSFFAIPILAFLGCMTVLMLAGDARLPPKRAHSGGRSLSEIARQPRFIVAVICAIGAYSIMSLVMTAAPLAMVECGLGEDNATLGIQWHVLAMFAPSFFTGSLIARYGSDRIIAIGMVLLTGCAIVALSGIDLASFWIALVLVGVGWNFGFIGATTMLTETYRTEERSKAQGLNDLFVFGSVAIASFSSGKLFSTLGWDSINWVSFGIVFVCVVAVIAGLIAKRRQLA